MMLAEASERPGGGGWIRCDRRMIFHRRPVRSRHDAVQRFFEGDDGPVDVLQFVEAEQADAKRPEVVRLIALQRNAGTAAL